MMLNELIPFGVGALQRVRTISFSGMQLLETGDVAAPHVISEAPIC